VNLWELYQEAYQLKNELEFQLSMLRIVAVDHPKVVARDGLAWFMDDYHQMRAKWADGFNACQRAYDVLEVV